MWDLRPAPTLGTSEGDERERGKEERREKIIVLVCDYNNCDWN